MKIYLYSSHMMKSVQNAQKQRGWVKITPEKMRYFIRPSLFLDALASLAFQGQWKLFWKASWCVFHFGPEVSYSWIDLALPVTRTIKSQNKVHKYPDPLTHEQKSNQEDFCLSSRQHHHEKVLGSKSWVTEKSGQIWFRGSVWVPHCGSITVSVPDWICTS